MERLRCQLPSLGHLVRLCRRMNGTQHAYRYILGGAHRLYRTHIPSYSTWPVVMGHVGSQRNNTHGLTVF